MAVPRWKPQCNTAPPPPAALTNTFRTSHATVGYQNVADAMTDVLLLPGIPDDLEIHVLDNPIIISVTDEQRRDAPEITIPASTATSTLTRDRLIRARNLVAGNVGRIQVIARWL